MAGELLYLLIKNEHSRENKITVKQAEEAYYQLCLAEKESFIRHIPEKNHDIMKHGEQIVNYIGILGKEFGLPDEEIKIIGFAALHHDIGKLKISDAILYKPGPKRLNAEERAEIEMHPIYSEEFIKPFNYPAMLARHHHENWDGTGYPDKKKGEEIPLGSRLIKLIDAFNAMTHERPYNHIMSKREALEEIMRNTGIQFDPKVVISFVKYFG